MTEWQTFCLSYLEIDRWMLQSAPATKLGVYVSADHLQPASQALLKAILHYAGLSWSQIHILKAGDPVHLYSQLWIFGEAPEDYTGEMILCAPSLQKILCEPIRKKAVFARLALNSNRD